MVLRLQFESMKNVKGFIFPIKETFLYSSKQDIQDIGNLRLQDFQALFKYFVLPYISYPWLWIYSIILMHQSVKSDLLFKPFLNIPLHSPFTVSIKKTRLMSSCCPVHQIKIKTNIITLYCLHKSTLLFSKNNHILEIKIG